MIGDVAAVAGIITYAVLINSILSGIGVADTVAIELPANPLAVDQSSGTNAQGSTQDWSAETIVGCGLGAITFPIAGFISLFTGANAGQNLADICNGTVKTEPLHTIFNTITGAIDVVALTLGFAAFFFKLATFSLNSQLVNPVFGFIISLPVVAPTIWLGVKVIRGIL